jgi:hypothetical protein
MTLPSSKTAVKLEAVERVKVPAALLFSAVYEEIRSSPTIHPNSPAVH